MRYFPYAAVRLKNKVFTDSMHAWALEAAINELSPNLNEKEILIVSIDSGDEKLEFGYSEGNGDFIPIFDDGRKNDYLPEVR